MVNVAGPVVKGSSGKKRGENMSRLSEAHGDDSKQAVRHGLPTTRSGAVISAVGSGAVLRLRFVRTAQEYQSLLRIGQRGGGCGWCQHNKPE